jgi:type III pantothenate kinase
MTLCDIGNSTFHFLQNDKEFKVSVDDELPKLSLPIYFISVNDKASKKLLNTYPKAINIKSYFKFNTSYSTTMGLDRVVACSYINDAIIVDCGSAITVDIMKKDQHLGGFIMPGIDAMKNIYPNISPKLTFNFENNLNLDKIPLNTNDAINYALLQMIILPIKAIEDKYNLKIVFTGETSKYIIDHFKNAIYNKHLIFESMKSAIRENT